MLIYNLKKKSEIIRKTENLTKIYNINESENQIISNKFFYEKI